LKLIAFIIESTLSLYITTTGGNIQSNQTTSTVPPTAKLLRLNVGITTGLHQPPKRILVVCSNHSRGIHLSEFAETYNILRQKFGNNEGIEFILASPKGGSVSLTFNLRHSNSFFVSIYRYQSIHHLIHVQISNVINGHQLYIFFLLHRIQLLIINMLKIMMRFIFRADMHHYSI